VTAQCYVGSSFTDYSGGNLDGPDVKKGDSIMRNWAMPLVSAVFAVAVSVLAFAGAAGAAPGASQYSRAPGFGQTVCCKRGNQDWWSTWGQCQAMGGHVTANQACRDGNWDDGSWSDGDRRVCCKRGNRDWWTTARQCRRTNGGFETANRECRDDRDDNPWYDHTENNRVCCKRGNHDWWTTRGQCRQVRGGYETYNESCRDDRNNNPPRWGNDRDDDDYGNDDGYGGNDDGDYQDPYGNPNRRVCCRRGNSDWWTSARECWRANGQETANKACR